jgi:hypothetical protein
VRTRQRLVLMRRQDCCESDKKNARQRFSVVAQSAEHDSDECHIRLLKCAQRVIEAVRQFADMREAESISISPVLLMIVASPDEAKRKTRPAQRSPRQKSRTECSSLWRRRQAMPKGGGGRCLPQGRAHFTDNPLRLSPAMMHRLSRAGTGPGDLIDAPGSIGGNSIAVMASFSACCGQPGSSFRLRVSGGVGVPLGNRRTRAYDNGAS